MERRNILFYVAYLLTFLIAFLLFTRMYSHLVAFFNIHSPDNVSESKKATFISPAKILVGE